MKLVFNPFTGCFGWIDPAPAETDPAFTAWLATVAGDIVNWNTAYGWGNHALAGYLPVDGTAADSDKLDGRHAAAFPQFTYFI